MMTITRKVLLESRLLELQTLAGHVNNELYSISIAVFSVSAHSSQKKILHIGGVNVQGIYNQNTPIMSQKMTFTFA